MIEQIYNFIKRNCRYGSIDFNVKKISDRSVETSYTHSERSWHPHQNDINQSVLLLLVPKHSSTKSETFFFNKRITYHTRNIKMNTSKKREKKKKNCFLKRSQNIPKYISENKCYGCLSGGEHYTKAFLLLRKTLSSSLLTVVYRIAFINQ